MKRQLIAIMCSAMFATWLGSAALAQQKTVKACNAEWTANKAAIQASGKTKKQFIEECRAGGTTAATPAAPAQTQKAATPATGTPSGAGQFATADLAKAHCPSDTVVWANLNSKIYHFQGSKYYGHTKSGAYMCEKDASATGFRAAKNEKPS